MSEASGTWQQTMFEDAEAARAFIEACM